MVEAAPRGGIAQSEVSRNSAGVLVPRLPSPSRGANGSMMVNGLLLNYSKPHFSLSWFFLGVIRTLRAAQTHPGKHSSMLKQRDIPKYSTLGLR